MPSKKQWVLIVLATLYGLTLTTTSVGSMVGGAVALFVISYGATLGYNGVSLTDGVAARVRNLR